MAELLRKLGIEKIKVLNSDFDNLYEKYKNKALEEGYTGEIKFIKSQGRVTVFVVI